MLSNPTNIYKYNPLNLATSRYNYTFNKIIQKLKNSVVNNIPNNNLQQSYSPPIDKPNTFKFYRQTQSTYDKKDLICGYSYIPINISYINGYDTFLNIMMDGNGIGFSEDENINIINFYNNTIIPAIALLNKIRTDPLIYRANMRKNIFTVSRKYYATNEIIFNDLYTTNKYLCDYNNDKKNDIWELGDFLTFLEKNQPTNPLCNLNHFNIFMLQFYDIYLQHKKYIEYILGLQDIFNYVFGGYNLPKSLNEMLNQTNTEMINIFSINIMISYSNWLRLCPFFDNTNGTNNIINNACLSYYNYVKDYLLYTESTIFDKSNSYITKKIKLITQFLIDEGNPNNMDILLEIFDEFFIGLGENTKHRILSLCLIKNKNSLNKSDIFLYRNIHKFRTSIVDNRINSYKDILIYYDDLGTNMKNKLGIEITLINEVILYIKTLLLSMDNYALLFMKENNMINTLFYRMKHIQYDNHKINIDSVKDNVDEGVDISANKIYNELYMEYIHLHEANQYTYDKLEKLYRTINIFIRQIMELFLEGYLLYVCKIFGYKNNDTIINNKKNTTIINENVYKKIYKIQDNDKYQEKKIRHSLNIDKLHKS